MVETVLEIRHQPQTLYVYRWKLHARLCGTGTCGIEASGISPVRFQINTDIPRLPLCETSSVVVAVAVLLVLGCRVRVHVRGYWLGSDCRRRIQAVQKPYHSVHVVCCLCHLALPPQLLISDSPRCARCVWLPEEWVRDLFFR